MKELLSKMVKQEIDVVCTTSSLRGTVVKVEDNVLHLKDDNGDVCYVAIDKIIAVWEKRDKERQSGFVSRN
ncbi:MAG: MM0924 family protein [Pyrinomonadaceae bacterium]